MSTEKSGAAGYVIGFFLIEGSEFSHFGWDWSIRRGAGFRLNLLRDPK
jgi:hypothetical protein